MYLNLFPNLERLTCNYQGIFGILDLSVCPNLKYVYCNNNKIEEIYLEGLNKLEYLHCSDNIIKTKDTDATETTTTLNL